MVEIQETTKTDIAVPAREFFTNSDIENIGTAISIIRKGYFLIRINASVRVGIIRMLLRGDTSGVIKPFSHGGIIRVPILDTPIDFGQWRVTQRTARIAPKIWKALPQAIEGKEADDCVPVEIVPLREKQFRCVVPECKKRRRK